MFGFNDGFSIFQQSQYRPFEDRPTPSRYIAPVARIGAPALVALGIVLGLTLWSHKAHQPPQSASGKPAQENPAPGPGPARPL